MRLPHVAVIVACLLLPGCVTTAVPAYDQRTDDLLSSLQKEVDTLLLNLNYAYDDSHADGKACAWPANVKAFAQLRVDLAQVRTRGRALYANEATLAALDQLADTFDKLEAAHRLANDKRPDHCVLPELITAEQNAMDAALGSLLKLELQKKKG